MENILGIVLVGEREVVVGWLWFAFVGLVRAQGVWEWFGRVHKEVWC